MCVAHIVRDQVLRVAHAPHDHNALLIRELADRLGERLIAYLACEAQQHLRPRRAHARRQHTGCIGDLCLRVRRTNTLSHLRERALQRVVNIVATATPPAAADCAKMLRRPERARLTFSHEAREGAQHFCKKSVASCK